MKRVALMLALALATVPVTAATAGAATAGPGERLECLFRNNVWEGEGHGLECLL